MHFANYGLPLGSTACDAHFGLAQTAIIKGHHVRGWRTGRGLRGDDRRTRLENLYPDAEQHGRRWWLVTGYSCIGECGDYAILAAGVTYGRVRDFHLAIGAAGD